VVGATAAYGLKASFLPPRWPRDLTRDRTEWVHEQTRVANRIHKFLEDANIQLGSVATDILDVSGRGILESPANRTWESWPNGCGANAPPRSRKRGGCSGTLSDHHRFELPLQWIPCSDWRS
jgi:transposase